MLSNHGRQVLAGETCITCPPSGRLNQLPQTSDVADVRNSLRWHTGSTACPTICDGGH